MTASCRASLGFIAAFLIWLVAIPAQAMEIRQYDALTASDKDKYVVSLVQATIRQFEAAGKQQLANKTRDLFLPPIGAVTNPPGFEEFEHNLTLMREIDSKKGPNESRIHVEHAFLYTLKQHGIDAPKDVMTLGKDFKPGGDH